MRTRALVFLTFTMAVGSPLAAQAVQSTGPASAMPRAEIAFGIDQWTSTPESSSAEDVLTRYGVMFFSRGRMLGQMELRDRPGELMLGDFLDLGFGFYAGAGRETGTFRIPVNYGIALAHQLRGGTQLVGRAGAAMGLGYDLSGGTFVGGRVKSGALGVEGLFITASEANLSQWFLRWYPRSRTAGFNVAVRYEVEQTKEGSLLIPERGRRDQSVMLVFSVER